MRIAVIGLGNIGRRHAHNLLLLGKEVMGFDPLIQRIYGDIPLATSEEYLWNWKPTHVIVCTPPSEHAGMTYRALQSGADVFVEKPLAIYADEARELVTIAKRLGRQLTIGYQLRAHASLANLPKDWDHLYIWDHQDMSSWPQATYPRNIMEEFSHELDLALWLAGAPITLTKWDIGQHHANIDFSAGARMIYVQISNNSLIYRRGITAQMADGYQYRWQFSQVENDQAYINELLAFMDGNQYATGEDGLRVCELIEALR